MVSKASLFVRMTERFSSQHLLKTPSTPVTPIPSIMSLVSLNGTYSHQIFKYKKTILNNCSDVKMKNQEKIRMKGRTRSGVFSINPCSNATPRSMCTTSAVAWSIKMFMECRSPRPTM